MTTPEWHNGQKVHLSYPRPRAEEQAQWRGHMTPRQREVFERTFTETLVRPLVLRAEGVMRQVGIIK